MRKITNAQNHRTPRRSGQTRRKPIDTKHVPLNLSSQLAPVQYTTNNKPPAVRTPQTPRQTTHKSVGQLPLVVNNVRSTDQQKSWSTTNGGTKSTTNAVGSSGNVYSTVRRRPNTFFPYTQPKNEITNDTSLVKQIQELQRELALLKREKDKSEMLIENYEGKVALLDARLKSKDIETRELQKKISMLEQMKNTGNDLQSEVDKLRSEIQNKEKAITDHERNKTQLLTKLQSETSMRVELQKQLENTKKAKYEFLEEELEELQDIPALPPDFDASIQQLVKKRSKQNTSSEDSTEHSSGQESLIFDDYTQKNQQNQQNSKIDKQKLLEEIDSLEFPDFDDEHFEKPQKSSQTKSSQSNKRKAPTNAESPNKRLKSPPKKPDNRSHQLNEEILSIAQQRKKGSQKALLLKIYEEKGSAFYTLVRSAEKLEPEDMIEGGTSDAELGAVFHQCVCYLLKNSDPPTPLLPILQVYLRRSCRNKDASLLNSTLDILYTLMVESREFLDYVAHDNSGDVKVDSSTETCIDSQPKIPVTVDELRKGFGYLKGLNNPRILTKGGPAGECKEKHFALDDYLLNSMVMVDDYSTDINLQIDLNSITNNTQRNECKEEFVKLKKTDIIASLTPVFEAFLNDTSIVSRLLEVCRLIIRRCSQHDLARFKPLFTQDIFKRILFSEATDINTKQVALELLPHLLTSPIILQNVRETSVPMKGNIVDRLQGFLSSVPQDVSTERIIEFRKQVIRVYSFIALHCDDGIGFLLHKPKFDEIITSRLMLFLRKELDALETETTLKSQRIALIQEVIMLLSVLGKHVDLRVQSYDVRFDMYSALSRISKYENEIDYKELRAVIELH